MVPPDSNARNLESRGPGQVGYMSSRMEDALGHLAESLKSVIPNFVACLVFLGIAFSFAYNHLAGGDYRRI